MTQPRTLIVLASIWLAGPAVAQPQIQAQPQVQAGPGDKPAGDLRANTPLAPRYGKPVKPTAPTVTAPRKPVVAPVRARDPALISPSLISPTAPRTAGWTPSGGTGGSQCRAACARDRYVCLTLDGAECAPAWNKCVAACPEVSGPALQRR